MKASPSSKTSVFLSLQRAQIVWFATIAAIWIGMLFASPLDPDYTAGELLDHASVWSEGGALYRSVEEIPYRVLNYPPLYLWGVRLMTKTGMELQNAGRLVNFFAFLASAFVLFRWLKREGCNNLSAGFATALLALSFPFLYSAGQFHLELSAIALSLAGLFLIQKDADKRGLILGGLLCGLACFVKQTQIVSAFLGFLWLLRYRPRQSFLFAGAGLATLLFGGGLLEHQFGKEVWRHLFEYTVGTYSGRHLFRQITAHFLPWLPLVLFSLWIGAGDREGRKSLRWWYFVGMSLWLLSSARRGSGEQYFIEWNFAVLLWIGPTIGRWIEEPREFLPRHPFWAILLAIQIVGADLATAGVLFFNLRSLRRDAAVLSQLCQRMGNEKRIVIEEPGWARICGHEAALHPFIMSSLARQKLWDEGPFLRQLEKGDYLRVILPFDFSGTIPKDHEERWTPAMLNAFQQHYRKTEAVGEWNIFEWRNPESKAFQKP